MCSTYIVMRYQYAYLRLITARCCDALNKMLSMRNLKKCIVCVLFLLGFRGIWGNMDRWGNMDHFDKIENIFYKCHAIQTIIA